MRESREIVERRSSLRPANGNCREGFVSYISISTGKKSPRKPGERILLHSREALAKSVVKAQENNRDQFLGLDRLRFASRFAAGYSR
jgi:hypothetical protein